MKHPNLYIIAGPNGAGKTTFAGKFLPQFADCREFVNADVIAQQLSPGAPEASALRAGRLLLERIRVLAKQQQDFSFETTLSGTSYVAFLRDLKAQGYVISLYFLWIPTVEMALQRIADRVQRGGHNIPAPVVRRRFARGLTNLLTVYQSLCDRWIFFDNAGEIPRIVAYGVRGTILAAIDEEAYRKVLAQVHRP